MESHDYKPTQNQEQFINNDIKSYYYNRQCAKCKKGGNIGEALTGFILQYNNNPPIINKYTESGLLQTTKVTQYTRQVSGYEQCSFYICKKCLVKSIILNTLLQLIGIGIPIFSILAIILFFNGVIDFNNIVFLLLILSIISFTPFIFKFTIPYYYRLLKSKNKKNYLKYEIIKSFIRSPEYVNRIKKGEIVNTDDFV